MNDFSTTTSTSTSTETSTTTVDSTNLTTVTDEGASTGPAADPDRLLIRSPKRLLGLIVLATGLAASETKARPSLWRREEIISDSGTADIEPVPQLVEEVRRIFDQGAAEFFIDGIDSNFSRQLLAFLRRHGPTSFRAIRQYLFTGAASPHVVSEALRWIADFDDASTLSQRWEILSRTLRDPSPEIRDGAILGFAALDDPRAKPLLLEAQNVEQIGELRRLIGKVINQLDRRG